ncbi:hypothetical protein FRC18_003247 [Serendipita sp. 400]|nr:hypothetical protein FRC18_003247 [Serendipita sp. 400]
MNNSRAQGLSYRDRSHLSSTPEPSWRSNSNTPAGSGRSSPKVSNPSGHRYVDDLEGQNDEALEGLTGKVKLLKELSIGIGQEVRESAVQLTHMNDAFAETGTILSGTFRRMNSMATRQGGRWYFGFSFLYGSFDEIHLVGTLDLAEDFRKVPKLLD